MNVCEIKYERTINGKLIKKTYLYGKECFEQEIPAKEMETVIEGITLQKKRILEQQRKIFLAKKGIEHE